MSLSQLLGQERAFKILSNALITKRVVHAYLFAGPEGVGKSTAAISFAKALNCLNQHDDSCDVCSSCRSIEAGNHPDVRYVEPYGGSLKIEQMRGIQKELWLRPYQGMYKVYIIADAETMTLEAANSMLKTLEDPPGAVVLILLTRSPDELPPTVVSRCQLVPFREIPLQLIEGFLKTRCSASEAEARLLAAMSAGRLGRALALRGSRELASARDRAFQLASSWLDMDTLEAFSVAEELAKDGHEELLEMLIWIYRDMLLCKEGVPELMVNMDRRDYLKKLAGKITKAGIIRCIEALESMMGLLRKNVNRRLASDVTVLSLLRITRAAAV